MKFSDYEAEIARNAYYPDRMSFPAGLIYAALGVTGEAGEVADEVKKMIRDDGGDLRLDRRGDILLECGDVLYYLGCVADELGSSLTEVAELSAAKLAQRRAQRNA